MTLESMGLVGDAIDLAQSVGTVVANSWFGTEDMVNDYYEMRALYENVQVHIRLCLSVQENNLLLFQAPVLVLIYCNLQNQKIIIHLSLIIVGMSL